jgi:hypothetical protein
LINDDKILRRAIHQISEKINGKGALESGGLVVIMTTLKLPYSHCMLAAHGESG